MPSTKLTVSRVAALVAAAAALCAATAARADRPWMNRGMPPDRRADLVEARMTLSEKLVLTSGTSGCAGGSDGFVPGVPRLGIPPLRLVGAGMGLSNVCQRTNTPTATELPSPLAMAASWDPRVAYRDGALIGTETRDAGFNVAIGGDVNLARDPRNGRTFEAEGEDPLLAGTMVGAQLRGTQSRHIPATIKHFAENNAERYRGTQSSNVDERTLRELELRAFQLGLEGSGASAVMCSYNRVNGTQACENRHLLTDVLKRDWGFRGWVMTDWAACSPPVNLTPSDICTTQAAAAAGLDQQQPSAGFFGAPMLPAVLSGAVRRARVDDMVHRILRSMFASALMDDQPVVRPINVGAGAAVARAVEERSAVLLKNAAALLPLSPASTHSIAVIGAPAAAAPPEPPPPTSIQPAGSSVHVEPIFFDTPLQGLEEIAPGATFTYNDGSDPAAAAELARRSRVAIVYAKGSQGEGRNLESLRLEGNADALISAVAAANPRTVVVLMTGTATVMPWLRSVGAVLEAWYPGERGGHAIARLLFGRVNPSGRLPLTFPAHEADLPTAGSPARWPGDRSRIEYREGLFLGYRWFDAKRIKPLFPFGFGLSYGGRMRFSRARLSTARVPAPARVADGHPLATLTLRVRNLGTRSAAAVPEVYVGFPAGTGEPPKRLVGWRKLVLRPGRSRRVSVTLDDGSLAYWNTRADAWRVAPGSYPVCVGSSSAQVRLAAVLTVGHRSHSTPACRRR